ncbi:MAG: hypothetical protein IJD20_01350 [Oscillospiraceae bacterium]|nr:hypothetical protein [Oscillospiraceae bacterium]
MKELHKRARKNRDDPYGERSQKPQDGTARCEMHDEKQQYRDQNHTVQRQAFPKALKKVAECAVFHG